MAVRSTRRSFLAMAALTPFALAACASSAPTASAVATMTTPGGKPTPAGADVYKIGLIGTLSGSQASLGLAQVRGSEIALDDINARGVNGKNVTTVLADDKGDPLNAREQFRRLVNEEKVVAVMGATSSTIAEALVTEANAVRMPYVLTMPGGHRLTSDVSGGANWIFRNALVDDTQGEFLTNFALQSGYKRPSLITDTTITGQNGAEAVLRNLDLVGLPLAAYVPFLAGGKDYAGEVAKLKSAQTDSIIFWGNGGDGATVRRALKAQGMVDIPYLHGWTSSQTEFVWDNRDVTEGSLVVQAYVVDNSKKSQDLYQRYARKYNTDRVDVATGVAQTYDATFLLAQALGVAKGGGEALRQALVSLESFDGIIKTYSPAWTETRRDALIEQNYILTVVKNGRLVRK
jgi:branched-chain amino acid transport system substrate-binding protein